MTPPLRLAFMGTPDFSVPSLEALIGAGHRIVCVYAQPPKPSGRGQQIQKTPVHKAAEAHGIEVRTPNSLRSGEEQQAFRDLDLDAAVVVAYGLILPKPILAGPRLGCFNIHASLLPRWRGAAPIQRALLAGDRETGIAIMQMEAGLDTGPVLLEERMAITDRTTAPQLHDALSAMGAKLIVDALRGVSQGSLTPNPQPETGVTYAAKLTREEGLIDWTQKASDIERRIRALNPWPGTFAPIKGEMIKILRAEAVAAPQRPPGTLLDMDMTVSCGEGALRLITVQRPGKKPTDGPSFLRGARLDPGQRL